MTLHCIARCATVLKIACNSNSKKNKKRDDIALQDMPLCLEFLFGQNLAISVIVE